MRAEILVLKRYIQVKIQSDFNSFHAVRFIQEGQVLDSKGGKVLKIHSGYFN